MTQPPQDTEKLRRAFASLADDGQPASPITDRGDSTDDTYSDEDVWQAVAGNMDLESRHAMVEKIARDPAAAESWRLAHALQESLRERGKAPMIAPVVEHPQRAWFAGLATAAALVLALGVWQFQTPDTPPDYRDPGHGQPTIESLMTGKLSREDLILRWNDVGTEARYHLLVITDDQTLIDLPDLRQTEFRIPVGKVADLASGTELYWQVEALLPSGEQISSTTFIVVLP